MSWKMNECVAPTVGQRVTPIDITQNNYGKIGEVTQSICFAGEIYLSVVYEDGSVGYGKENRYRLINKEDTIMASLLEKAVLAVTPEPMRSFRKAGITNGDNLLTEEGVKVFLSYLLSKNQDAFKADVVDGILAEMKDSK